MNRVLLVDTNFSSLPFYEYLKANNYEVFVCGNNSNDCLARVSNHYIQMDYSDVDDLTKTIISLDINYLIPGCNDASYRVCTQSSSILRTKNLKSFFGLDDHKTFQKLHDKARFREILLELNLPTPQLLSDFNFKALLNHQVQSVIVKPVDAYSGRGITVVHNLNNEALGLAVECAKSFSQLGQCLIEEYIEGQLYSHSAFLSQDAIIWDCIVEEHGTVNPFAVDTSRVVYNFPKEILEEIRNAVVTISKSLNLTSGLFHTQFIKKGNLWWFIEVTRRCPGDLYSYLIQSSTGFQYAEFYLKPFLNIPLSASVIPNLQSYIIRHTVSQAFACHFKSIQFQIPMELEQLIFLETVGSLVNPSPFSRIALLFAKAQSENTLLEIFDSFLKGTAYYINSVS